MSTVHVSTHPLVAHHVCTLRNPATPPSEFRRVVRQLTALVAVEATAGLPTRAVRAPTPLADAAGRMLADRIAIVPILRAGLGMADGLLELLPDAEVWHVGLYRDEATLQPKEYYNKLPKKLGASVAIVVDPMLATARRCGPARSSATRGCGASSSWASSPARRAWRPSSAACPA